MGRGVAPAVGYGLWIGSHGLRRRVTICAEAAKMMHQAKRTAILALSLVASSFLFPAVAQGNKALRRSFEPSKSHSHLACFQFGSPGCESFNQMTAAGDSELISQLEKEKQAWVCFRRSEDVFIVVSHFEPKQWWFNDKPNLMQISPVEYRRFKAGVLDDFQSWSGIWSLERQGVLSTAKFESILRNGSSSNRRGAEDFCDIDSSEVSLSYPFESLNRSTTSYGLTIRESTLRFVESWIYPAASGESNKDEKSGQCVRFLRGTFH